MDTKEVKVGERYKLELLCISTSHHIAFETPTGNKVAISKHDLECVSPAAPKYDPCRKFRMGDEVRVTEWNGRLMFNEHSKVFKCSQNEHKNGLVPLKMTEDDITHLVHACHLELLTPVEELEPYYVSTNIDCSTCTIFKRVGEKKFVHSAYYFVHGKGCSNAILGITEAKAAAEAECKRLNEEYRKELKND